MAAPSGRIQEDKWPGSDTTTRLNSRLKSLLAAIKGQQTVHEIAATYGVHPNQVLQWKKQALEVLPDVFSSRRMRAAQDDEALQARLYQPIGQLKVELDWLKKTTVVILTQLIDL